MRKECHLTHDELTNLLNYDKDTGYFTWVSKHNRKTHIGRRAEQYAFYGKSRSSEKRTEYMYIKLDDLRYFASHIAWFYHYGVFPKFKLRHINEDMFNNSIRNLGACFPVKDMCFKKSKPLLIDNETIYEIFHYDKYNGLFTRKINTGYQKNVGYFHTSGIMRVMYRKRLYNMAALAWLYVYGVWPKFIIGYVDGDHKNLKINNLYETIKRYGLLGKKDFYKQSIPHPKNASWGYPVSIDGKYIGTYKTKEEADNVLLEEKNKPRGAATW